MPSFMSFWQLLAGIPLLFLGPRDILRLQTDLQRPKVDQKNSFNMAPKCTQGASKGLKIRQKHLHAFLTSLVPEIYILVPEIDILVPEIDILARHFGP